MRLSLGKRHPLTALLLAVFLLAAELAVYAHLLDHELKQNDAQCAVCLHAAQLDKPVASAGVALATPDIATHPAVAVSTIAPTAAPLAAFAARGPPQPFASLVG